MEEELESVKMIVSQQEKETRKTKIVFVIFFLSMFVSFIPLSVASVFSMMVCICTLATVYSMRGTAEEDGLVENHMTFMIRTFWRVNLYFLITSVLAILYILIMADYSVLKPCFALSDKFLYSAIDMHDLSKFNYLIEICKSTFFDRNLNHLKITAVIAFLPIILYLLYRCVVGWLHISKREIVEKL